MKIDQELEREFVESFFELEDALASFFPVEKLDEMDSDDLLKAGEKVYGRNHNLVIQFEEKLKAYDKMLGECFNANIAPMLKK